MTTDGAERCGRGPATAGGQTLSLDAIQADVLRWCDASFEPVNRPWCWILKAVEELGELAKSGEPVEAADVTICMLAYCEYVGVSLQEQIEAKMRKNWQRHRDGVLRQNEWGMTDRTNKDVDP